MTPASVPSFGRPRVVLSECLELAAVRYNAQTIRAPIVKALASQAELVPVCPEVGIGLGVPRDPIRLVQLDARVGLYQPATDRWLTEPMADFAGRFLEGVGVVDGFLLKSRSPSCGTKDVKVYGGPGDGASPSGKAPGRFAAAVLERFPDHPIEDEGRLTNRAIRDHWLTRVFALATLRRVVEGGSLAKLMDFHASYKLVLMAYGPAATRELGRLLAEHDGGPFRDVVAAYRAGFLRATRPIPGPGRHVNVIEHARGYFKDALGGAEKRHLDGLIGEYRAGRLPRAAILAVLRSWIERFDEAYLRGQRYFQPYPAELVDLGDSGNG